MIGIIYKSRHGSTARMAEKISAYLPHAAQLIEYQELSDEQLQRFDTIVLGIPVYSGKLDDEMVEFVQKHQSLLAQKHFSIYVMALFYSEFMSYLTQAFSYDILKDVKALAGLGGVIDASALSVSEKMSLSLLRKRRPFELPEKEGVYTNYNEEEVAIFARKIAAIDKKYRAK